MSNLTIGVIVGSLRKDSSNSKLANALGKLAPADFSFKRIEIGDLPLYNQDDDANQAPQVQRLKAEIAAADAVRLRGTVRDDVAAELAARRLDHLVDLAGGDRDALRHHLEVVDEGLHRLLEDCRLPPIATALVP